VAEHEQRTPVEAGKQTVREAARGRDERTPWIALTGVTLVVAAIVAVILVAAMLIYFLV
jgi:hypothetical protein